MFTCSRIRTFNSSHFLLPFLNLQPPWREIIENENFRNLNNDSKPQIGSPKFSLGCWGRTVISVHLLERCNVSGWRVSMLQDDMGNRKPPQGETETFWAHIPSNGFQESSSECKATCDKWHSLAELWGPPKGRLCPFPFTMHVIGAGQLNMKQLHCDNAHTWRQAMELLQQKAGSKGQRSCYLFISEEAKVVSTHTTFKACCGGVRGHWCKSHRQCFWKRSNTTGRQVWRCFGLCAWWVLREGDLNRCYQNNSQW